MYIRSRAFLVDVGTMRFVTARKYEKPVSRICTIRSVREAEADTNGNNFPPIYCATKGFIMAAFAVNFPSAI